MKFWDAKLTPGVLRSPEQFRTTTQDALLPPKTALQTAQGIQVEPPLGRGLDQGLLGATSTLKL